MRPVARPVALTALSLALVCLLVTAGCGHRPFDTVIRQTPNVPVPHDVIARVARSTVTLSWTVSDPSRVVRYRIYRASSETEPLRLVDSTTATEKIVSPLLNGHTYCFQISAVDPTGFEGARSERICASPATYSVAITSLDGNTLVTKSATVTLRFSAPITTREVGVSEDSTFANEILEPYPVFGEIPYTFLDPIPSHQGTRRIYARFVDDSGNESLPVTASIRYDGFAGLDDVNYSPAGPVFSTGDVIRLSAAATGRETGPNASVQFSLVSATKTVSLATALDLGQAGDAIAGDGLYEVDYTVTSQTSKEISDATLVATFTDNYGNTAVSEAVGTIGINVPPPRVDITSLEPTCSTVTVRWQQSTVPDFAEYHLYYSVDSTLAAGSECTTCPTPPNCVLCRVPVTSGAGTTSTTVTGLSPFVRYFFRLYVVDTGGLTTGSETIGVTTPGCAPAASESAGETARRRAAR